MVRHKKVGDNEEKGKDLKMLEIDEIVALLKLDGLKLHYFVKSDVYVAYIRLDTYPIGRGGTQQEAANNAWRRYVDSTRDRSAAQA